MGFRAAIPTRLAARRVSVQQSRPAWQPNGFRCSDCGRLGPGFPVLAVRTPKRRSQIGLFVVFTTKYAGKLGACWCRWSADCTETRFAANAPAKTAPKRVFLPPGARAAPKPASRPRRVCYFIHESPMASCKGSGVLFLLGPCRSHRNVTFRDHGASAGWAQTSPL